MKKELPAYDKKGLYLSYGILIVLAVVFILLNKLISKDNDKFLAFYIVNIVLLSLCTFDILFEKYKLENYNLKRSKVKPKQLLIFYKNNVFVYTIIFIALILIVIFLFNILQNYLKVLLLIVFFYYFIHFIYYLIMYIRRLIINKKDHK